MPLVAAVCMQLYICMVSSVEVVDRQKLQLMLTVFLLCSMLLPIFKTTVFTLLCAIHLAHSMCERCIVTGNVVAAISD